VRVDEAEPELALINLGLNARDAMSGGGRLAVLARGARRAEDPVVPEGATWVSISVADTGVGMSAEVIARAFDPLCTTKSPGQGTGLGLGRVPAMCTPPGGTARNTSEPGVARRWRCTCPRAPKRARPRAARWRRPPHWIATCCWSRTTGRSR
jgi:C4-dicarboxylate-specific signal transduction histidine kinase